VIWHEASIQQRPSQLPSFGQLFATTLIAQPRVCAALMGILIKGLGADHVNWGTDALWTGSPR
jgi:hypothetical protein